MRLCPSAPSMLLTAGHIAKDGVNCGGCSSACRMCSRCIQLKALEQSTCSTVVSGRGSTAAFVCLVMCSGAEIRPTAHCSGPSHLSQCVPVGSRPCRRRESSQDKAANGGPQFVLRPSVQGCDLCRGHVVQRGLRRLSLLMRLMISASAFAALMSDWKCSYVHLRDSLACRA